MVGRAVAVDGGTALDGGWRWDGGWWLVAEAVRAAVAVEGGGYRRWEQRAVGDATVDGGGTMTTENGGGWWAVEGDGGLSLHRATSRTGDGVAGMPLAWCRRRFTQTMSHHQSSASVRHERFWNQIFIRRKRQRCTNLNMKLYKPNIAQICRSSADRNCLKQNIRSATECQKSDPIKMFIDQLGDWSRCRFTE